MARNGVAGVIERSNDLVDGQLRVIEFDGHRVLAHVGFDGLYLGDLLDGRTGLRGGTASDNPGRLQYVGYDHCARVGGEGHGQRARDHDFSQHGDPPLEW